MTSTPSDPTPRDLRRLRNHFQYTHPPFIKGAWAQHMYDSTSQKELLHGLLCWIELRGIALLTGPSGIGKSITVRRFAQSLDPNRYRVVDFTYLPGTTHGFLRSLCRKLGLPQRLHTSDLYDQAKAHLHGLSQQDQPHPVLILDDAEGLTAGVTDVLRRLVSPDLDVEDRVSLLLSGTDDILPLLRQPAVQPMLTRIVYTHQLRAFGVEDTRNYIRHHLDRATIPQKTFSEDAMKRIFQVSQGKPRVINQLALQLMIQATVSGKDTIDGDFTSVFLSNHPLYPRQDSAR